MDSRVPAPLRGYRAKCARCAVQWPGCDAEILPASDAVGDRDPRHCDAREKRPQILTGRGRIGMQVTVGKPLEYQIACSSQRPAVGNAACLHLPDGPSAPWVPGFEQAVTGIGGDIPVTDGESCKLRC